MPLDTNVLGFEYGYPDDSPKPWYGLWNPNYDCFLWVSFDLRNIEMLQMLMSTKALTKIVGLDPSLYKNNIIDNTCCISWTIDDVQIGFNEVYKNYNTIEISSIKQKDHANPKAVELQDWIMMLNKWIRLVENNTNRFDNFLATVMGCDPGSDFSLIYRILLLGVDLAETDNQAQICFSRIVDV